MIKNKSTIKYIFLFLYFIVFIYCFRFFNIASSDELIKYWGARGMHDGYLLYKDMNIIVPPLSYILGYLVVGIYDSLMSIHVLSLLIWGVIFYFIHKIADEIGISFEFVASVNILSLIYFLYKGSFFYDYNILCLMFIIIAVYFLLYKDFSYKNAFIMALSLICAVWTKHSTGFFYFIAFIIAISILHFKESGFFKKALLMVSTGIAFSAIMFAGLLYFGVFDDFINLCLLGVSGFANENQYLSLDIIFIIIIAMITVSIVIAKHNNELLDKEFIILGLLVFASLPICYPITTLNHCISTFIFTLLLFYYEFRKSNLCDKLSKIIFYICLVLSVLFSIFNYKDIKAGCDISTFNGTSGMYCDSSLLKHAEAIGEYRAEHKDKKIYFINKSAVNYACLLDYNNGYYDFLWSGNTGKDDEVHLVSLLKNTDSYILCFDYLKDVYGWDENIGVYIKDNFEKVDGIDVPATENEEAYHLDVYYTGEMK